MGSSNHFTVSNHTDHLRLLNRLTVSAHEKSGVPQSPESRCLPWFMWTAAATGTLLSRFTASALESSGLSSRGAYKCLRKDCSSQLLPFLAALGLFILGGPPMQVLVGIYLFLVIHLFPTWPHFVLPPWTSASLSPPLLQVIVLTKWVSHIDGTL